MPLDAQQVRDLLHKQETKTLKKPPNKRQLEIEVIKAKQTKQTRKATQYATLPEDGPVTRHDGYPTVRCASRGCSSPTCFKYKGTPYCYMHLIPYLSMEIVDLTRRIKLSGDQDADGNYNRADYF
jgi:hypothetical protein